MTNTTKSFLSRAAKELTPKQEQLDINDNGKIDKEDLANLRKGAKPDPVGGSTKTTAASNIHRFLKDSSGGLTKDYHDAMLFKLPEAVKMAKKIENSAIIPDAGGDFLVVVLFHPALKW